MRLFSPFTINGMTLANRIVLPAMVTRLSGEDGRINADVRDRYLRFAKGEPGLIVVEAMSVHGGRSGPLLRMSDDSFIDEHARMARDVHASSPSKIAAQIIHFLKISRSGWRQTIAELSKNEIAEVITGYAAAAGRVRRAGYDAVELHMAHAYTLSSFLSLRNRRQDEYGRSLENRMRPMTQVILAVRAEVGADFPVGVRFDGEECIKDGYTLSDAREMALRMAKLGVDWISISAGGKFEDAIHKPGEPLYPYTGYSGDRCMPSVNYPDGANIYLADGIKAHLNSQGHATPVVATGKIRTPELAESLLAGGRADLIGMARALLADPDWPRKARDGRSETIVRCVYGNVCKALDENFRKVRCVLWPKGALQAPDIDDAEPPRWLYDDPNLKAQEVTGRVQLKWNHASDDVAIYGYEIYRSADGGAFDHLGSVKGVFYVDDDVVGGVRYRYWVRAYDPAGNRTPRSNVAEVMLPDPTPGRGPRAGAAMDGPRA
ncbi:MAG TPA: NADH:flavin oxidoreductase [Candidatus Polarisedimenticolia bacterium]|nr:NADH:flavin oxidoreductase [Candidatus Polarisedimenticolia bacterium]